MKHIWICQCGESGLGVEEYVKHMYLYAELDETIRQDEDKKKIEELNKFNKYEKDQGSELIDYIKKRIKKALHKDKL